MGLPAIHHNTDSTLTHPYPHPHTRACFMFLSYDVIMLHVFLYCSNISWLFLPYIHLSTHISYSFFISSFLSSFFLCMTTYCTSHQQYAQPPYPYFYHTCHLFLCCGNIPWLILLHITLKIPLFIYQQRIAVEYVTIITVLYLQYPK